jgi:dTDP-4-dehydrorhamnose reductase
MPKVIILGANGMAGHMIGQFLLENGYQVVGFDLNPAPKLPFVHTLNVTDLPALRAAISSTNPVAIVNCIGVLNHFADQNPHQAVFLNSYLPHWLVNETKDTAIKVVHLSTDCVFSGKNSPYREDSFRDGDTFYDRSKALGEIGNSKDITLRQSIIGPDINPRGIGLLNWFLQQQGDVKGYKNAIWNGITTLQLAKGVKAAIEHNLTGLYHYVSGESVSKHRLLELFCEAFQCKQLRIIPFDNEPKTDKSLQVMRPSDHLRVPTYQEMLNELNTWVQNHKTFYPHYFSL